MPYLLPPTLTHTQAEVTKSKGFAKDIRKGGGKDEGAGGMKKSDSNEVAQVGSQGVGFGLGLEEYMKGSVPPASSSSSGEEAEAESSGENPVEAA